MYIFFNLGLGTKYKIERINEISASTPRKTCTDEWFS
jgi:hypothetical protein